jgi:hypothetical protein
MFARDAHDMVNTLSVSMVVTANVGLTAVVHCVLSTPSVMLRLSKDIYCTAGAGVAHVPATLPNVLLTSVYVESSRGMVYPVSERTSDA